MANLVHPISFRLGYSRFWTAQWMSLDKVDAASLNIRNILIAQYITRTFETTQDKLRSSWSLASLKLFSINKFNFLFLFLKYQKFTDVEVYRWFCIWWRKHFSKLGLSYGFYRSYKKKKLKTLRLEQKKKIQGPISKVLTKWRESHKAFSRTWHSRLADSYVLDSSKSASFKKFYPAVNAEESSLQYSQLRRNIKKKSFIFNARHIKLKRLHKNLYIPPIAAVRFPHYDSFSKLSLIAGFYKSGLRPSSHLWWARTQDSKRWVVGGVLKPFYVLPTQNKRLEHLKSFKFSHSFLKNYMYFFSRRRQMLHNKFVYLKRRASITTYMPKILKQKKSNKQLKKLLKRLAVKTQNKPLKNKLYSRKEVLISKKTISYMGLLKNYFSAIVPSTHIREQMRLIRYNLYQLFYFIYFFVYLKYKILFFKRIFYSSLHKFFTAGTKFIIYTMLLPIENFTARYVARYIRLKLLHKYPLKNIMRLMVNKLNIGIIVSEINGFKLQFCGRFSRKDRATYAWKRFGKVTLNQVANRLDYSLALVILVNSTCGIKVWLSRAACMPRAIIV